MNSVMDITAVLRSRKSFYDGKPIWWYEFMTQKPDFDFTDLIPPGFLNVECTVYYEFGGSKEEAIKCLTEHGFVDIVEGDEL